MTNKIFKDSSATVSTKDEFDFLNRSNNTELPKIGDRYKNKEYDFIIEIDRVFTDDIGTMIVSKCKRPYELEAFYESFEQLAEKSYAIADAMIKVRSSSGKKKD